MKNFIKKIAFVYNYSDPEAIENEIADIKRYDLDIDSFNLSKYFSKWSFIEFELKYSFNDYEVFQQVQSLRKDLDNFDTIIIYGTLHMFPRLIFEQFNDKNIIYWASDDPIATTAKTLPYAMASDIVLTQTPLLNETQSHAKFLTNLTGKPVLYHQFGYLENWLSGISEEKIIYGDRNIDISFLGAPAWRKDLLLSCKRVFGRRLKIYSNDWNFLRHYFYDLLKHGVSHYVPKARNASDVYVNSKMSINISPLGGPSAIRTWHVPICGAAMLCDHENGLKEIFKEDNLVVPFKFMNDEDLISKIDWLLTNENKAKEIGINGYFYTKNNLRFSKLLADKINYIKENF